MVKDFTEEFNKLLKLVKSDESFCFTRFSDGEITILRNEPVVLADDYFIQGDLHGESKKFVPKGTYNKEEQKEFFPEKHAFFHRKLFESFLFKKHNYFKGIPAQNCLDNGASWKFCIDTYGEDDLKHLTFASVMINDNYERFIREMVPEFSNKKIVLIANENSNVSNLPFRIVKMFNVGSNCMVNNYYLIDEIKQWILENDIKNHLFLFSASSLSNLLGYELYKDYDNNQYLDIGSSLGPLLGLTGWRGSRHYLNLYWSNPKNPPKQGTDNLWN
jgi:hypothetical protein